MFVPHLVFALLFPALALWLVKRFAVLRVLDSVVLCYLGGMLYANAVPFWVHLPVAQGLVVGSIGLGLPLLLFGANFMHWLRHARPAVLGFGVMCLSVLVAMSTVAPVFAPKVPELWKSAGMIAAAWVGGSVNLNAVGIALQVTTENKGLFVATNAAEMVWSLAFIFFVLTVAKPLLSRFMRQPVYTDLPTPLAPLDLPTDTNTADLAAAAEPVGQLAAAGPQPQGPRLRLGRAAVALGLALLVAGGGAGAMLGATALLRSQGTPEALLAEMQFPLLVGLVTLLGIAASFVGPVRRLQGADRLGDYLMLVFCTAFGTLIDASQLTGNLGWIFAFAGIGMVLLLALHFGLCTLLRIDVDTAVMCTVAGILSTPFVSSMARRLSPSRELLLTGLTTSIAGYALGNFIGLGVAYLLRP